MIVNFYWLLLMWEYNLDKLIRIVRNCLVCHTVSELNINIESVVTPVDNI